MSEHEALPIPSEVAEWAMASTHFDDITFWDYGENNPRFRHEYGITAVTKGSLVVRVAVRGTSWQECIQMLDKERTP